MRKPLKGQKNLKGAWAKKVKQAVDLKDSKVKTVMLTDKHEGMET